MALNTLPAGAFADSAITSSKINLANNFAFTGTVTGAAKIGQIVYQNFTTAFSTTSATYADTGLTLAITPTASDSTLYIMANMNQIVHNGISNASFKLFEDSTELEEWYKASGYVDNAANSMTFCIQRSASSTSARTYKVQMANKPNTNGTLRLNNSQADGFSAQSNMMIIEVLA